jgi:hypothetical protein
MDGFLSWAFRELSTIVNPGLTRNPGAWLDWILAFSAMTNAE